MAELITALNDLFGGFRARATMVEAALRSPEVAFVLVTSPAPMSIQEVLYLEGRLAGSSMPRGALVVNRVRQPPAPLGDAGDAEVATALATRRLTLGDAGPQRLLHAHADAAKLAALDAQSLEQLTARVGDDMPIVLVPELPSDVRDARLLADLATVLTA